MSQIKKVLVVSRMIQTCKPAIEAGFSMARHFGADLYIIHSIYNPFSLKGWSLGALSLSEQYEKLLTETRDKIAAMVADEVEKGLHVTELIREGEPTEEILKTVKDEKIDLLIMLAHEEGFMENLLFDRSNKELVRKMPCNILLLKKEPHAV